MTAEGQQPADQEPASAPLLTLREGLPPVLATSALVQSAAASLAGGDGPVAVDAERASGHRYSQRAYLVQVRRAGAGTALLDPVPFGPVPNAALAPLMTALGDEEWVFHAASQDLPCLAELGLRPRRLFDTELAGRLLGYPRVGLAVLVEEVLGYAMRKEHSAVDWSRRPLPAPWLRYAALDVEMLLELRTALAEQLRMAGKNTWAQQEFVALAGWQPGPRRPDPWRRTSGMHRVRTRAGLAVVRALWEARDQVARRHDVTPTRILRDDAITAAAAALTAGPRGHTPDAAAVRAVLEGIAGFTTTNGRRNAKAFTAAAAEALQLAEDDLPPLKVPSLDPPPARAWATRFPEAAERLRACRAAVQEIAEEHTLPAENLLAPDAVRRLCWEPPEPVTVEAVGAALTGHGARPWQVALTAPALVDCLG